MSSTDNLPLMHKMLNILRSVAAPECHVDVGELAKILQAIKFRVKSSGECAPSIAEECSGESTAPAGISITITCLKSRQQVVLQRDADVECTCTAVDEERGSWEVTAVTFGSRQSLVETTSGAYPPLEADVAATVRRLMEYVGAFAAGRVPVPPQGGTNASTPRLSDRRMHMARLSLGAGEDRQATLAARYRSLDTLIDTDGTPVCSALPKPGALLKAASNTSLTSEVCKAKSESCLLPPPVEKSISPPSPSASSDVFTCLLNLQDNLAAQSRNLNRAIALCRNASVPRSSHLKPKQVDDALPPPRSITTKTRYTGNTAVAVRPVSIAGAPATTTSTSTAAASKAKKMSVSKNKYAHIKSTIPKPTTKP